MTETSRQRQRTGLRLPCGRISPLAVMLGVAGSIAAAHAAALAVIGSVLSKSGQFSTNTDFAWMQLQEPPKQVVENFRPGAEFPRQA